MSILEAYKNIFKLDLLKDLKIHLPSNEAPKDQGFVEMLRQKFSELNKKELEILGKDKDLRKSLFQVLSLCETNEEDFKAYIEALKKLPHSSKKIESQLNKLIFQGIEDCNLPLLKKILASYQPEHSQQYKAKIEQKLSKAISARDLPLIENIVLIAQELQCPRALKRPIQEFLLIASREDMEEDLSFTETLLQKTDLKTTFLFEPLCEACSQGSLEYVELFFKYGGNIKSYASRAQKALFQAVCQSGSVSLMQVLIEKIGQDAFNKIRKELLPTACQLSSPKMLIFLLTTEEKIPIDYKPLLFAAAGNSCLDVLQYLLDNGAKETFDSVKNSLLTECLRKNRMEMFDFLVASGADPETLDVTAIDPLGNTPLHDACQTGNLRGVKILIKLGASPEIENENAQSPFALALINRHYPIVHVCLDKKPSLIDAPFLIEWMLNNNFSSLDKQKRNAFIESLKEADFQKLANNFSQDCLDSTLEKSSWYALNRLALFFVFLQRDPSLLHQYARVFQKLVQASFSKQYPNQNVESSEILNQFIENIKDPVSKVHISLFCDIIGKNDAQVEDTALFVIDNLEKPVPFFLPLLKNPVTAALIADLLIEHDSGLLEKCLKEIPLHEMPDRHKLYVLPYLPAEEIPTAIGRCLDSDKHALLQHLFTFGEGGDAYTLAVGLHKMQVEWLPDENAHPDIIESLEKLPLLLFAFGAEDAIIRFLLMPFLRFMDEPSLYSVIPFVSADEFPSCLPDMGQNYLTALKGATLEQKRAFLAQEKHVTALLPPLYAEATTKLEALQGKSEEERKIELLSLSSQILTCHQQCIPQLDLIEKALVAKSVSDNFKEEVEQALAPHRARIESQKQMLKTLMATLEKTEEIDPAHLCPITQEVMQNPVSAHGHTFEKEAIEQWLGVEGQGKCPLCRTTIKKGELRSNDALKKEIEEKGLKPQSD